MDDARAGRVGRVHGVEAAVRPDRREAAEDLVAADLPASVDALGGGAGQQQRDVVAGLAVEGGEDLAGGGLVEDEAARVVAGPRQVGGHAGPVDVHVDGQRRGRRVVGEAAHQRRVLVEAHVPPAQLGGQRGAQEPGRLELLEVLVEEAVLAVVDGRSLVEAGEHLVAEELGGRFGSGGHGVS